MSLVVCGVIALRGDAPLIQIDDAIVTADAGRWTIGNALIRYTIGDTGNGVIGTLGIQDVSSGRDWHGDSGSDALVRVDDRLVPIGGAATHFTSADVAEFWGGVRLDLHYTYDAPAIEIVRSYACYPGSAVIETWTTVTALSSRPVTVSDLNAYTLSIENGTLNWITGLQTPEDAGGPFTRAGGDLDDGQTFYLGSDRRASETALPWYSVHAQDQDFFGSILWSGSWRFAVERHGDYDNVRIGMPPFATTIEPGATLEFPHAIFGLTNAAVPDTSLALKGFIDKGLRHGRPLTPYLTANTWYSFGTDLNEGSMLAEMEMAASAGIEQFVVDAGWWANVNWDVTGDFIHNWGNWTIDYDRFPNGLGYLTDRAHQLGMRFGVWVEPERVDRALVGQPGMAAERFLATHDGLYEEGVPNGESASGQICLVDPEARAWLLEKLYVFLDEVHPDYLKWDNNLWVNCNRVGHGHGLEDGNFQHHRALQSILDEIRYVYPALDIEDCASGGNRISLDMLARTEAAWVDDQTGLSNRTRHSLEGLLTVFPSPYLLSFSTAAVEGLDDEGHTGDAYFVMRSRMLGVPGTSWRMTGMDDDSRLGIAREADLYKRLRPLQLQGSALLLTPQVPDTGWAGWDGVQYLGADKREAAVLAFNNVTGPPSAVFHLKGLIPDATYSVASADAGDLGTSTGQALMEDGIELQASDASLGHVVFVRAIETEQ